MIQYLKHDDIDFKKWDECVEKSLNGIIYPYSHFLNQVSPKWDALISDHYNAVMPLPIKKKAGISYLIQPMFAQQLGIFSPDFINENKIKSFLNSIPAPIKYVNIKLNTHNQLSAYRKTRIIRCKTYELDLIQPYESLYKSFSTNTKRNIKRSVKEKVFVTNSSEPQEIINLFRTNTGKKIDTIKETHYSTLKHLIYSSLHRGNAVCYSAFSRQNSLCAGAVFLMSHRKAIMLLAASNDEGRSNGAMSAIINHFIMQYAGHNVTLDFEGSNIPSLARFYSSFGSKECVYLQVIMNRFPFLVKDIVNFIKPM